MALKLAPYPVYLVFPDAGARFAALGGAIPALRPHLTPANILGVDVHYRAVSGTAILAVRVDMRVITRTLLDALGKAVASAGGSAVDPSQLGDPERKRFVETLLPSHELLFKDLPGIGEAITALAARLGQSPVVTARGTLDRALARFRRGDSWANARPRGLTEDGVYLATGSPPGQGESVEIELLAGGVHLKTKGMVVHVTTRGAAADLGAGGFGVRFAPEARERAAALVVAAAGSEIVTPHTPPPRKEPRFPVCWKVVLASVRGAEERDALDVSTRGMFVSTAENHAIGEQVAVTLSDGDSASVSFFARVHRVLGADAARRQGLAGGIGLEIVGFTGDGEARYAAFIRRVSARAQRRIAVIGSPKRAGWIIYALGAAGYVVTSAEGPAAVDADTDFVAVDRLLGEAVVRQVERNGQRVIVVDTDPLLARVAVDEQLLGILR